MAFPPRVKEMEGERERKEQALWMFPPIASLSHKAVLILMASSKPKFPKGPPQMPSSLVTASTYEFGGDKIQSTAVNRTRSSR